MNDNTRTPEQRAFLGAQPAYDEALATANALGGPPSTLNALLAPEAVPAGTITLHPLTLGGYLLLQATGNAWLTAGEVTVKDNAVVILALTEPEWSRGQVSFGDDLAPLVNQVALAHRLTDIAHAVPVHVWPQIINYLFLQLKSINGESGREASDPLVLTLASPMPTPPAGSATPATPDGSA